MKFHNLAILGVSLLSLMSCVSKNGDSNVVITDPFDIQGVSLTSDEIKQRVNEIKDFSISTNKSETYKFIESCIAKAIQPVPEYGLEDLLFKQEQNTFATGDVDLGQAKSKIIIQSSYDEEFFYKSGEQPPNAFKSHEKHEKSDTTNYNYIKDNKFIRLYETNLDKSAPKYKSTYELAKDPQGIYHDLYHEYDIYNINLDLCNYFNRLFVNSEDPNYENKIKIMGKENKNTLLINVEEERRFNIKRVGRYLFIDKKITDYSIHEFNTLNEDKNYMNYNLTISYTPVDIIIPDESEYIVN